MKLTCACENNVKKKITLFSLGFHNLVQWNENHLNFSKYTAPHENVMKTTLKIFQHCTPYENAIKIIWNAFFLFTTPKVTCENDMNSVNNVSSYVYHHVNLDTLSH